MTVTILRTGRALQLGNRPGLQQAPSLLINLNFVEKTVLSGIGTDRPSRRRPATFARPGHSRGAGAAGAGGAASEMTIMMVSTKAARDRAFPADIRQSSHCQQEKQSKAAAAVGGHHEKGSTS